MKLSRVRINFNRLLGEKFNTELILITLDWMLKTGRKHRQRIGRWDVEGISQFLYDYSGNDCDSQISIPFKRDERCNFFDAVFARAIYKLPSKSVQEWREEENIYPNKYRVLKRNLTIPKDVQKKYNYLNNIIYEIFNFNGSAIKKEFAHPDYLHRINPVITGVKIYTIGNGWSVKCFFSFENTKGSHWDFGFYQKENESLWEFFDRSLSEIKKYKNEN